MLDSALKSLGVPQELIDDPDFIAGVTRGLETAVETGSLGQSLEDGLSKYVREGGGFSVDLPDAPNLGLDLGLIEDALKPIVDTVASTFEPFVETADEVIDTLGKT